MSAHLSVETPERRHANPERVRAFVLYFLVQRIRVATHCIYTALRCRSIPEVYDAEVTAGGKAGADHALRVFSN